MRLDEVEGGLRRREVLLVLLDGVVGVGAGEREAPLEPAALRRVHQLAVAVDASVDAAVLAVPAVLQPERHDVGREVCAALRRPVLPVSLRVH